MRRWLHIILASCLLWPSAAWAQIAAPTDLSGLVLWVDAQDVNGNGVQPANGAAITTWVDKSGGGRNLTRQSGTITYQATGFDGVNPGLRFPLVARMTGPNVFGTAYRNQMTVFFVNANNTITNNFSVMLNGTNVGSNITDGRFGFHTPWSDNTVYFDAGACCGTTRLQGGNPNALTETALYTGLNDEPGNRQWLRIDGQAFRTDTTGHNANVSRGIHIGDLPDGHQYDGRFAEIVIYNRALTLAEVEQVECYLMAKWKPADAPAGCVQPLTVEKSSSVSDTGGGTLAVPGQLMRYAITVSKPASAGVGRNSIFVVDSLPPQVVFHNGDVDDGGPLTEAVGFTQVGSGLTFTYANDVRYSDAGAAPTSFAACTYTPSAGYDPNVRHICFNPKGALLGSPAEQSFTVFFRTLIQ